MFVQQMAVLRGQAANLRDALEKRMTPEQLVQLPSGTVDNGDGVLTSGNSKTLCNS